MDIQEEVNVLKKNEKSPLDRLCYTRMQLTIFFLFMLMVSISGTIIGWKDHGDDPFLLNLADQNTIEATKFVPFFQGALVKSDNKHLFITWDAIDKISVPKSKNCL